MTSVPRGCLIQDVINSRPRVSRHIAPGDNMYTNNMDRYLAVGHQAARLMAHALDLCQSEAPRRILDFACGWGRVTRHLHTAFPTATIVCSDIWKEAMTYTVSEFGHTAVAATSNFDDIVFDKPFDLIWCGSLITHLPEHQAKKVLALFKANLANHGVAIFSTHGRFVQHRLASGLANYSLSNPAAQKLLSASEHQAFSFAPIPPHTEYGFSLTAASWVIQWVHEQSDLTLRLFSERAWDDHQDVFAIQKRSFDASWQDLTPNAGH